LRGIAKETRRKVHQAEPHFFDGGAKVFAHQSVCRLMDRGHRCEQKPELNEIGPRLVQEVEKRETIRPHFPKPICPHAYHDREHGDAGPYEPWREQEPDPWVEPRNVFVGVVPYLDGHIREINGPLLLFSARCS